jgi:hypothetical protein
VSPGAVESESGAGGARREVVGVAKISGESELVPFAFVAVTT